MKLSRIINALGLAVAATFCVTNSQAAEKIAFNYPPFGEFYIHIEDLASFSKEGKINSRLSYFTKSLDEEQLNNFKTILGQKIVLNPVTVYRFTNSSIGEAILSQLGEIIKSDLKPLESNRSLTRFTNRENNSLKRDSKTGILAIRGAINQAVNHPDGLTLLNVLQQFPLQTVYFDLAKILHLMELRTEILQQRKSTINSLQEAVTTETKTITDRNPNLSLPGNYKWYRLSLNFDNPYRSSSSPFELYLPKTSYPVPLIIISHGLGSNRQTFDYLGQHFASYGFAVAIPEHISTNFAQFERFFAGRAKLPPEENLILQPLDLKYLIDWLESESELNEALKHKINFKKIGLLGHSLGAYSSLALTGGKINWDKIQQQCLANQNIWLNLSILLQCSFQQLPIKDYQLFDSRIQAAIAISPLSSIIFGQEGIKNISVPTMIISGVEDPITPAVPEQIYPFTWLQIPHKYLLLLDPANHFSFLADGVGILPVPDSLVGLRPGIIYPALKHFTTAFWQNHLEDNLVGEPYLESNYADFFTNEFVKINIYNSIDTLQLESEF